MNYSIDWDGPGEWDDDECDCMDEEIDILTGAAHCWCCGARRYLSTEQLEQALKDNAAYEEAFYEETSREHQPKEPE